MVTGETGIGQGRAMTDRVTFDLDEGVSLLRTVAELVLSLFKPVVAAVVKVSEEGQAGFLLMFGLFFSIALLQMYARAKNGSAFAEGLYRFGRVGAFWTLGYLGLLVLQATVLPIAVVLVTVIGNTLFSGTPTVSQFITLLGDSAARSGFLSDVTGFVFTSGIQVLPLGFRASFIVLAAFACMWLVGRTLGRTPAAA